MLKYFCLIVLIMSSFGWTQKPIEFHVVNKEEGYRENVHSIEYFKVNKDNKFEPTRLVLFHPKHGRVLSDVSYVNGSEHGKYVEYHRYGGVRETGEFKNGWKHGKWYEYETDELTRVTTYNDGEVIDEKFISSKSGPIDIPN